MKFEREQPAEHEERDDQDGGDEPDEDVRDDQLAANAPGAAGASRMPGTSHHEHDSAGQCDQRTATVSRTLSADGSAPTIAPAMTSVILMASPTTIARPGSVRRSACFTPLILRGIVSGS